MRASPLISRPPSQPMVRLGPASSATGRAELLTCGEFLGRAGALSRRLPARPHVINLCGNRYHFLLGFCAAILAGQCNLLPPNRTVGAQQSLREPYPRCYVLHDGCATDPALPQVDIREALRQPALPGRADGGAIAMEHLAAIAFTSGSTGESQANAKYWRTLVESSAINARYFLPHTPGGPFHLLATVPGQHMWGLETSILLPLFANVCSSDGRPLFPGDIAAALQALPAPRLLVSTPVHLRTLVQSGAAFPQVDRILCATAPLEPALAREVETVFGGELHEIYGCSEVGSLAWRRTARDERWHGFDGLHLEPEGDSARVSAAHLPREVVLADRLTFDADGGFRLGGRDSDMLEVAGKRGSLQELNRILLAAPGVADGVVFLPDAAPGRAGGVTRLAALVVLREGDREAVIRHLRAHVDPAFVPRPCHVVAALPREENGKLPRRRLLAMLEELKRRPGG